MNSRLAWLAVPVLAGLVLAGLVLAGLSFTPAPASAGCQSSTKLALHVVPTSNFDLLSVCVNHGIDIQFCCDEGPNGCGFTVQAGTTGTYAVYVVAAALDPGLGMDQIGFGVNYDGAAESGVDISGWISCATTSETIGSWPEPGSAITLGWGSCQATELQQAQDYQTWQVIGGFQVTAYGSDALRLQARTPDLDAFVRDCEGDTSGVYAFGTIGFGEAMGWDGCNADFYSQSNTCCVGNTCVSLPYVCCLQAGGTPSPYNPCETCAVPVAPSTWGLIKRLNN